MAIALPLASAPACSWDPADPTLATVEGERIAGYRLRVTARLDLPVPPRIAWAVLSDYERLAQFIPDLKPSRRISAPGAPLLPEQKGESRFLIFRFPPEVEGRPPRLRGGACAGLPGSSPAGSRGGAPSGAAAVAGRCRRDAGPRRLALNRAERPL